MLVARKGGKAFVEGMGSDENRTIYEEGGKPR